MRKTLLTLTQFAVSGLLVGYLVYQACQDPKFGELVRGPKDWGLIGLAFGLCLVSVLVTIVRWYFLVRAINLPFTLRDAMRLGFLGFLFNFVSLGSVGGDLFKALFLAREKPGRRAEAVATVVVDRVVGLYALLLVASATVLANRTWDSPTAEVRYLSQFTLAATAVGAAMVLILLVPGFTNGALSEWLAGLPRVGPILRRLIEAVRMYRRRFGVLVLAVAMSLGVHLMLTLGVYLIGRALPGEVPSLADHLILVPLGNLASAVPITFNGIGALEWFMDYLYQGGQGLLVSFGYRLTTIVVALVGAVVWWFSRREVEHVLEEEPSTAAAA